MSEKASGEISVRQLIGYIKTALGLKYTKPASGIPASDLASAVQTSLGKADTALQTAPVSSVNNKTGAVTLTASDVGAGTYSKPSGGIPASDLATGVIPSVPQMATDPNMTDWTTGKTVDAAVLATDFSTALMMLHDLGDHLNAIADSDDTTLDQLSEIVAYIKNNKSLIDGITTSKVSVSDIVDSLVSADATKPLSANQGRVLKALIDAKYTKPSGGIPASDLAVGVIPDISGKQDAPLIGSVGDSTAADYVTPTQVYNALLAGKDVIINYSDMDLQGVYFTAWGVGLGKVAASIVSRFASVVTLTGTISNNSWSFDSVALVDGNTLAGVAFSGSYTDLTNKPTIPTVPTNVSAFTNDSGYQNAQQVQTAIANAAELPAVTASDNGKSLVVVNGVWGKGDVAAHMAAVISGTDIEITNLDLATNVAEVGA